MIKYATNLEGQELLNLDVLSLIDKAGQASKNPDINITSLWRSPARQAQAMYDNISNNVIISYAAPGKTVTELCQQLLKEKQSKATIVKAMENKIIELAAQNKLVSLHCVSEDAYPKTNVIDISKDSSKTPNPRDFVKALLKDERLLKVLTPFSSDYNDKRIVFSSAEAAIHIEMKASESNPPIVEPPVADKPTADNAEIKPPVVEKPTAEQNKTNSSVVAPPVPPKTEQSVANKNDTPNTGKNIFQKIFASILKIFTRKS